MFWLFPIDPWPPCILFPLQPFQETHGSLALSAPLAISLVWNLNHWQLFSPPKSCNSNSIRLKHLSTVLIQSNQRWNALTRLAWQVGIIFACSMVCASSSQAYTGGKAPFCFTDHLPFTQGTEESVAVSCILLYLRSIILFPPEENHLAYTFLLKDMHRCLEMHKYYGLCWCSVSL